MENLIKNGNFPDPKLDPWQLDTLDRPGQISFIPHTTGHSILLPQGFGITQAFGYTPAANTFKFDVRTPSKSNKPEALYAFNIIWFGEEISPSFDIVILYATPEWTTQELTYPSLPDKSSAVLTLRALSPAPGLQRGKDQELVFGPVEFAEISCYVPTP